MSIIKVIHRQNCTYKLTPGNSGESSINISNEVFELIKPDGIKPGQEESITFNIVKEDFIKATCLIINRLPLYKSTSTNSTNVMYSNKLFSDLIKEINDFFGQDDSKEYTCVLLNRNDGRKYLKNLTINGFSIRDYLVEKYTALEFDRLEDKNIIRVLANSIKDVEDEVLVREKEMTKFVLKSMLYFRDMPELWSNIDEYVADSSNINIGTSIKIYEEGNFSLVGMFIYTTDEDIIKRNDIKTRWNMEHFTVLGKTVFLSTAWYPGKKSDGTSYSLMMPDFSNFVSSCFGKNYVCRKNGTYWELCKLGSGNNSGRKVNTSKLQMIYYGTPGSGKSWKIKKLYEMKQVDNGYVEDEEKKKYVIRTTFHPDTDYSSFVGCYKPIKDENNKITYDFVPQAFTEAYIKAWEFPQDNYYLVIEEINRGNCAQIFGDLFQLLDRKENGYSEYPIIADKDLRDYLERRFIEDGIDDCNGIYDGKLCLPPNLSIIASMNTSDQSLFPMDSAFKRRWTWEYVPIEYDNPLSSKFNICIDGEYEPWPEFLKLANDKIKKVTDSEDKQMGNFFIKHSVNEKEFCDKVMFYIWSEVGKDNYRTPDAIFKWVNDKGQSDDFSFNELYISEVRRKELLKGFIKYLKSENGIDTQVGNVGTE